MIRRQKSVENLAQLLQSNGQLKHALEISLQKAQQPGIETLEKFYIFLDGLLTHIPTEKELMPSVRQFYYLLSKSPHDILRKDKSFNDWINEFVNSRGNFLDTTESAKCLDTFIKNPEYNINDYIQGPSGWLTYNQFLARQLKPGKRPIAELCNDDIIASPADGIFMGHWPIEPGSTITVKDTKYAIADLLNGSAYQKKFEGGVFAHIFLGINDYHRYHVPVSGVITEVKRIPATTWVTEEKKPDGSIENTDDIGFQFTHTRAHVIMESPLGFAAVIPVGMGHISSVNITVEENTKLVKGNEFGYFAFGGSDIIMLFESNQIEFIAKKKQHYKQGEQIAKAME
jgi:phosphatidylserine decarboxylase